LASRRRFRSRRVHAHRFERHFTQESGKRDERVRQM
jgi:hypothetical protein